VSTELIDRARAGDTVAFGELIEPYRRELQVHCYRILGSAQDAEDTLQETLLAAWQGLGNFEGRASIRTWLYRVATSRCLNALRSASRRPSTVWPKPELLSPVEPTRTSELVWLEPYPDILLDGIADHGPGPEARYEAREAISLAFIVALQLLPPRQRAVLVLRDVLGFHAAEAASILDTTPASVTSALKRARATLQRHQRSAGAAAPPPRHSAAEQEVVSRLATAFESGDVDGIIGLLTEDVWLSMPPIPLEYQGRELAAQFFAAVAFRDGRRYRLVAARANNQPAFGVYLRERQTEIAHANGLLVLTLVDSQITTITRFDNSVFHRFGLPLTLSG
jgi:RNA polymerase sigma-70 factor (TIGR02960 family)